MKNCVIFIFSLLLLTSCKTQTKVNQNLRTELNEILRIDQSYRALFDSNISSSKKDSLLNVLNISKEDFQQRNWGLVLRQDSLNIKKIEKIIKKYGYPGKSLVGEPTNLAAFYVIQHSNKISKYLPLVKKAAERNEIPFRSYAMMLDRYLVEKKQEQIYGTQGFGSFHLNSEGIEEWIEFIWPIKDLAKVNELRKKAGFAQTMEEYSKDLYGNDYILKNFSLSEAINISQYKKDWD